jgi:ubiquinone/menaquinone biosynthesis C-methylase UbiE
MSRDFDLGGVVPPWGRSAAEYEAFFALSDISPSARILDCAGGPASFAGEWSKRGRFVVAADPVYRLSGKSIAADFEPTAMRMLEGMCKARERFKWDHYGTPENVIERRRQALAAFQADFDSPHPAGRYVAARLPELPFPSDSFDLALCAHFLFLYSDELDLEMHIACIMEMLRVAQEVRVFPLLDMDGRHSRHLESSIQALQSSGRVELVPVPFEFRHGDCRMLRFSRFASRRSTARD